MDNHVSQSLLQLESVLELLNELPYGVGLPVTDPDYTHPTHADLRLVLDDAGLIPPTAAELLGVTSETMKTWLAPNENEKSPIPYSAWRALILELHAIDTKFIDPVCANWWLVNRSAMAESMEIGPDPTPRIVGSYTGYRTANNVAAQKNGESA